MFDRTPLLSALLSAALTLGAGAAEAHEQEQADLQGGTAPPMTGPGMMRPGMTVDANGNGTVEPDEAATRGMHS